MKQNYCTDGLYQSSIFLYNEHTHKCFYMTENMTVSVYFCELFTNKVMEIILV